MTGASFERKFIITSVLIPIYSHGLLPLSRSKQRGIKPDFRIKLLSQSEHCWFTWEKFNSVIKNELYKRVRKNNLREKLMERRESYTAGLLREIEKKYEMLQGQVALNKCSESYDDFSSIRTPVREMMDAALLGKPGHTGLHTAGIAGRRGNNSGVHRKGFGNGTGLH